MASPPDMVSLGMFLIDEFSFADAAGNALRYIEPQIGGGGTYAAIGARIWLPPRQIGMIIDRGNDFPPHIQSSLDAFGSDMWLFRDHSDRRTARSLNSYRGEKRTFEYLTPRIQITPRDLEGTRLARAKALHVICAPARASIIIDEVKVVEGWAPTVVYEPVEYACVPEELPALVQVLPYISILSPNAHEALRLLSMPLPPPDPSLPSKDDVPKTLIEEAARRFLSLGVGSSLAPGSPANGWVIVRCAGMGAYVCHRRRDASTMSTASDTPLETAEAEGDASTGTRPEFEGLWIPAFWTLKDVDKVVDVTGAGNSFLGALTAALALKNNDVQKAVLFATVAASFVIEQEGLPRLDISAAPRRGGVTEDRKIERWNGDLPEERLNNLALRCGISLRELAKA